MTTKLVIKLTDATSLSAVEYNLAIETYKKKLLSLAPVELLALIYDDHWTGIEMELVSFELGDSAWGWIDRECEIAVERVLGRWPGENAFFDEVVAKPATRAELLL
jgi:hypothetical protein